MERKEKLKTMMARTVRTLQWGRSCSVYVVVTYSLNFSSHPPWSVEWAPAKNVFSGISGSMEVRSSNLEDISPSQNGLEDSH